jgi:hypothetical protein
MRFRLSLVFASVIAAVAFLTASAAQAESGFDGKWIGTVTFNPINQGNQNQVPPPQESLIIITKDGTTLGIVSGVCRGRYEKVRRMGDTLSFGAGDCKLSVSLSKDGRTLTEKGTCNLATTWMIRQGQQWPVSWLPLQISGTFHRMK